MQQMANETKFKLRRLHKQRRTRHKRVTVMNREELAQYFGVNADQVLQQLLDCGWAHHQDSAGGVWATPPPDAPPDSWHTVTDTTVVQPGTHQANNPESD